MRCCEIIDRFHPEILYFDWWIQHSSAKPYLKKLAAYYYNRAAEWGGGVINYKHDAFMFGTAVPDIERGQFADAKPFIWQTDTAVCNNSWGYTRQNDYKTPGAILRDLVDIVSKNGRLLLNIGPKPDGTIPEEDQRILLEIGRWLRVNGEAIYGAEVWRWPSEGPTTVAEGQFADGAAKNYTSRDIRFTVNNGYLYATVLQYPENGEICIERLREADASRLPLFHGIILDVDVLGFAEKPAFRRDGEGLHITTTTVRSEYPVVFRITVD